MLLLCRPLVRRAVSSLRFLEGIGARPYAAAASVFERSMVSSLLGLLVCSSPEVEPSPSPSASPLPDADVFFWFGDEPSPSPSPFPDAEPSPSPSPGGLSIVRRHFTNSADCSGLSAGVVNTYASGECSLPPTGAAYYMRFTCDPTGTTISLDLHFHESCLDIPLPIAVQNAGYCEQDPSLGSSYSYECVGGDSTVDDSVVGGTGNPLATAPYSQRIVVSSGSYASEISWSFYCRPSSCVAPPPSTPPPALAPTFAPTAAPTAAPTVPVALPGCNGVPTQQVTTCATCPFLYYNDGSGPFCTACFLSPSAVLSADDLPQLLQLASSAPPGLDLCFNGSAINTSAVIPDTPGTSEPSSTACPPGLPLGCECSHDISGGAPFDSGQLTPIDPGSACTLRLTDSFGDGWNGAEWTGFGRRYELPAASGVNHVHVQTLTQTFTHWCAAPLLAHRLLRTPAAPPCFRLTLHHRVASD